MSQWWSWLLTAVGVFGIYLAGRRSKAGWAVGLGAQTLWIAYAVATRQWGFIVSALAYGWVYGRNWLRWHHEQLKERTEGESECPRCEWCGGPPLVCECEHADEDDLLYADPAQGGGEPHVDREPGPAHPALPA